MSNNVEMVEDASINSRGHLILQMTSGRQIDAGQVARPAPEVEDVYIDDTDDSVIIQFSNGDIITAFKLEDLGYKDVKEVRLDGYDVYADYIDGTSEFVGSVLIDANSGIVATYINRIDGFIYGIRYNGDIETIGSAEQFVADKLSEQITQITSNDLEEVIIHTDKGEYNIGKIYYINVNSPQDGTSTGKKISNIFVNTQTGILTIVYDDDTFDEAGSANYVTINGHPIVYANAELNSNNELILEYMKVDDNGRFETQKFGILQPDGSIIYEDRFLTEKINVGNVGGKDGRDGTIFVNSQVMSDGMLVFTDENGNQMNAGFLPDRSVSGAYIEDDTGVLVLVLNDGTEIKTSNVLGKDGEDAPSFTGAYIDDNDGMLWLELEGSDVPDIPAGIVAPPSEVSMRRDENDNILFTLHNGKEYNAGQLPGVASKYVTEMKNVGGIISVKYSDNPEEWFEIGNINSIPENISSDNNKKLVLEYADGTKITSKDRVYGLDGDGIIDIELKDRDLSVYHTTDHGRINEEKVFKNVKGRDIVDITYDHEERKINFILSDNTEKIVELPESYDGVGIDDLTYDLNDYSTTLNFHLSNETTKEVNIINGAGVKFDHYTDSGDIVFKSTLGKEYKLPVLKGRDGNSISNVYLSGKTITLEFTEQDYFTFDLPVGSNQNKTVRDISYNEADSTIQIDFKEEDAESITVPIVRPEDGDVINDVYVENDNLVLLFQGRGEVTFPSIRGRDGNSIKNITKEDNELIFELENEETINIGIEEPRDGIGIKDIKTTEDNLLAITLDSDVEKKLPLPVGKDAVGIESIEFDPAESNDMVFNLSDGSQKAIPQLIGNDGKSITGITYDDENEKIKFEVEGEVVEEISFRTGKDGNSITDVYFDDLDLVIETDIADNGEKHTAVFPLLKGKDGEDGNSIKDIFIDDNASLIFKIDDEDETVYSFPDIGKYVDDIKLKDDGKLEFVYSNGDKFTTEESIKGIDGNGTGIETIKYENNSIIIEISDYSGIVDTIDIPLPVNAISKTEIINDELIFTMTDSSEINVGRVDGRSGKWISDAKIDDNDKLTITVTDGNSANDEILVFENFRGNDGRHLENFSIDHVSGDFTAEYSDGNSDVIGNIKKKLTLSIWDRNETPYEENRVVIHSESMYLSLVTTSDEPPSSNWREVSFSDRFGDAVAPRIIFPRDNVQVGDSVVSIEGTQFSSTRQVFKHRQFLVRNTIGSVIVYDTTSKSFSRTIPVGVLQDGNTYTVQIRDYTEDGTITPWSPKAYFSVVKSLESPIIHSLDNSNAGKSVLQPSFYADISDSVEDYSIIWELFKEGNENSILTKTIDNSNEIFFDVPLDSGTQYHIRAMIKIEENTSSWSNIISFVTEDEDISYLKTPKIVYNGPDIKNINPVRAVFSVTPAIKSEILKSRGFQHVDIEYEYTEWEIRDVGTGEMIESFQGRNDVRLLRSRYTLGRLYSIRARHYTRRFNYTNWSDWTDFKIDTGISAPVISTDEDINNFPHKGKIYFSSFESLNDVHTNTTVEIRDNQTGKIILKDKNYSTVVEEFEFLIPNFLANREIAFRIKYHGCLGDSDWSNTITLNTGNNYGTSLLTYTNYDKEESNHYDFTHVMGMNEIWRKENGPVEVPPMDNRTNITWQNSSLEITSVNTIPDYDIRRNFFEIQQVKLSNDRVLLLPMGSLMFLSESNSNLSRYAVSIIDNTSGEVVFEEKNKIGIPSPYSSNHMMLDNTLYAFSEPSIKVGDNVIYIYYPIRNNETAPVLPVIALHIDEENENITREYITVQDFPSSVDTDMIEMVTKEGEIYISEKSLFEDNTIVIHKLNKEKEIMHSFNLTNGNYNIDYYSGESNRDYSNDFLRFLDYDDEYLYIAYHGTDKAHGASRTGILLSKVLKSTGKIKKTLFYSYGNLTTISDDFHYNIELDDNEEMTKIGAIRLSKVNDRILISTIIKRSDTEVPILVYGNLDTNNEVFRLRSITDLNSLPWSVDLPRVWDNASDYTPSIKQKMIANADKLSSVFDENRSVVDEESNSNSISIINVLSRDEEQKVIKFQYNPISHSTINHEEIPVREKYLFKPHRLSSGSNTPPFQHMSIFISISLGNQFYYAKIKEHFLPSDNSTMHDFYRLLLIL